MSKFSHEVVFSCNMHTGFSDRNSDPKLCVVSIANNGKGVTVGRDMAKSLLLLESDCLGSGQVNDLLVGNKTLPPP